MHAMVLMEPGAPLRLEHRKDPSPGPAKCESRSMPAAFVGPICMSSTASCRDIAYPIVPGHEVVGKVEALGHGVTTLESANGSAFPGSVTLAANVSIAGAAGRTCAIVRCSPATCATAVLRRTL